MRPDEDYDRYFDGNRPDRYGTFDLSVTCDVYWDDPEDLDDGHPKPVEHFCMRRLNHEGEHRCSCLVARGIA